MATNETLRNETYEVSNATGELRLHLEAARALLLLMESAYFEPRAERFVKGLTVAQWEQIQCNMYTLANLVDALMEECRSVEGLAEQLHAHTINAQ